MTRSLSIRANRSILAGRDVHIHFSLTLKGRATRELLAKTLVLLAQTCKNVQPQIEEIR